MRAPNWKSIWRWSRVRNAARSASAPYQLGDLDGDGDVDVEDLRLLAKLKNGNGRKWNADQLKAGDFNGNGKLDNDDYQALRALLKEKGILRALLFVVLQMEKNQQMSVCHVDIADNL